MNSMPHRLRRFLCASFIASAWLYSAGGSAQAQVFRLDDSASPQTRITPQAVLDETGRPLAHAVEPQRAVLRFGRVLYRLDTRAHVGRTARLFFVRAPQALPQAGITLHWRTADGRQRGSLQAGERALVWAGTVEQATAEMTLDLDLNIDLQAWQPLGGPAALRWDTHFELERAP